jgi:transposase
LACARASTKNAGATESANNRLRFFGEAGHVPHRRVQVKPNKPVEQQVVLGPVNTTESVYAILRMMELTNAQYRQIESCLPTPRGNVTLDNRQVLNTILYVVEHGCKWRGLPKQFGNWHTIYTRMNRWSKSGVLDRVFTQLQQAQILRVKIKAVALDSTLVKVHPAGTGALKKRPASPWPLSRRMDHGTTIAPCINDAMRSNGCSVGSRDFDASSHGLTSSMLCSWRSSRSR